METSSHPNHTAASKYVSPPVNLDLVAGIAECLSLDSTVPLFNGDRTSSLLDAIDTIRLLSDEQREKVASRLTKLLGQHGGVYNVTGSVPLHLLNGQNN